VQELVDIGERVRIKQKGGMEVRGVETVLVYNAEIVRVNSVGVRIVMGGNVEVIPWSSIIEVEIISNS
jgi:hypothetical protein